MKAIKFGGLFLAITAMVSCQKENIEPTYMSDPTAVKLSVAVGSPFTRSNPVADGTTSAAFKSGDKISVTAGAQTAVLYTLDNTSWTPEAGKYLKWETPTMTFNAYYPVGVNNASMSTFDVPADQTTLAKIEQADYMTYTSPEPVAKAESVNMSLTRRMTRVVVDGITFNDQYASGYTVTEIKVSGNTNGYGAGSVNGDKVQVQSYTQDGKFYALLSPTTTAGSETFFTLTVKKVADNMSETLTVKGIPALEAGKSYTYSVVVGKNTLNIDNVTVTDWTTSAAIPGGEATVFVDADPATNTLTVNKAGKLTEQHITRALNGGTVLTVLGTLNEDDVTKLATTTSLTGIDLRGAEYTGGTVPIADWSGCTNLTKILINTADATACKTAWSTVSSKLFYPGQELVYKVDAMTGKHAGGIPCVVIDITGFDTYRLISRNPYFGHDNNGADEIYVPRNEVERALGYKTMMNVITPWGGEVATLADMKALESLRPNSFTIVTKAENGDEDKDLSEVSKSGFMVKPDDARYLKRYTYDKETRAFALGFEHTPIETEENFVSGFFTFEVTK